jgi:repressor LexA
MQRACKQHAHAPRARVRRHADRVLEVLRAVGARRSGWPHRAGQHHRLVRRQHGLQEEGGLLHGVGAVRDDDAVHVGLGQPVGAALRERQPDGEVHVLAVDLGDLFGLQLQPLQRRQGAQQVAHADLRGLVIHVLLRRGGAAGDRAAGAEYHDFSAHHLHSRPICSKIQVLDINTVILRQPAKELAMMMDAPKLTARQQQILDLIQSAIARTGAPPTRAEIAEELGFKSANAAEEHLQALARKGVIELVSGTSRGIRLRGDALRAMQESRAREFSLPLPGMAQLGLPLIGRVAAGSPILAQEHVDQTYYVESGLFQRRPDYLLKVRGMSMRDAGIMDGDLLAVQATRDAKNGQIIVARLGDDVTVKRFRRNKHLIELHAENPDYPTIVVEPGEPFEVEGIAVGLIRNTMLM